MPAYHFQRIEAKWQAYWETHKTFHVKDFVPGQPKLYILDMFPYPSGDGLHVGHPEGYTATDILSRYKRMTGFQVLHPMGWDAFGLPAEQHAVKSGAHPRETTRKNINTFRRQVKSLGFSYDWDREVDTTDPKYYRWTQWIFRLIFETWYDPNFEWTGPDGVQRIGKGRPIAELPIPPGLSDADADLYRDSKRLAYRAEVPVNWCPGLGTVLANEEVIDGKSEVGGFPVTRIPLKQWMLRITEYADRLVSELDPLNWPRSVQDMQRNWIGRSEGAEVDFRLDAGNDGDVVWRENRSKRGWPETPEPYVIRVYTTRPDTLFGATYMVLSPEHPLVDEITTSDQKAAVDAYRTLTSRKSEFDRTVAARTKTGVATGAFAVNPVNHQRIPIWIADYVLMTYGTGAIMAVPGHDERDFEFATVFQLPIQRVVASDVSLANAPLTAAESEYGIAVNSAGVLISLDGMTTAAAKTAVTEALEAQGLGRKAVNTKLRDWLFSRQRYWGEPFPVLLDAANPDRATVVDEADLPVLLPDLADFLPSGKPEPPLNKAAEWVNAIPGKIRETNTMPQWAGSCWYYLRYIDPDNDQAPWDPAKEKAWMPVDLYVGGAEHAVLHLLYSRFWHKVLFDRGLVSTPEPFQRLVNQGMILGETEYTVYHYADGSPASSENVRENDDGGHFVAWPNGNLPVNPVKLDASQVVKKGTTFVLVDNPEITVHSRAHKMSKSRRNVINPDTVVDEYGADSLRLYEMFMGPLEATKPWSMKGVEGVYRFLGRAWRMIIDEDHENVVLSPKVVDTPMTLEQSRITARTAAAVTEDFEALRFNTSISRLMEFVNAFTAMETRPLAAMKTFALLLAPLAPHVAEELWETLGEPTTLAYAPWPTFDPALLKDDEIEIPVQVNGRLRGRVTVPADADRAVVERVARENANVQEFLTGKSVQKVIILPGKLVNFVVKDL